MPRLKSIDKPFLIIIISLVVVGFFVFLSASLGLTARENIKFSSIVFEIEANRKSVFFIIG